MNEILEIMTYNEEQLASLDAEIRRESITLGTTQSEIHNLAGLLEVNTIVNKNWNKQMITKCGLWIPSAD